MKFLEIASLELLNAQLSVESLSRDSVIHGKLEAYSCKRAGSDKKLYKTLEEQYQIEFSKSPEYELATSPFGPMVQPQSRKSLIDLISVLNASFPDYDFCNVKPEQFSKEDARHVIDTIGTVLAGVIPNFNSTFGPKLWATVDSEIRIKESDIYSYIPDLDSDPYAEDGNIWSFNYFFYNRKLKRVLFFTCRAVSKLASGVYSNDSEASGVWMYEDAVNDMEL